MTAFHHSLKVVIIIIIIIITYKLRVTIQSTHLERSGIIIKIVAINIITTILNMRAPGLRLHKAPLFAWAMLSQSVIIILCIPVLAGLCWLFPYLCW